MKWSKVKAAIKREQSDACISYAEREQVRCETSKVNSQFSIINYQLKKSLSPVVLVKKNF